MRLKRLELSGFKTFAERTMVEFASQMTGIVGPNGSGKSNIFDAIRWALGEGNLRALRGVRTEDIIFAGTDRRRPLAMAEVTLTLDNEDGSLVLPPGPDDGEIPTPLAFAEVTVTRRAMRNAESQYFINGLSCRLRDIQTMFLGTGLGGHTYALITQGEVEEMLDATPEERRMILEEAAGLAKYKRRRHDAERRMAAAETTLLRVTDILGELDALTAQLAMQAETAERYQAQTRELRTLELSLQVEEIRRGLRAQRRVRDQLEEIAVRRNEIDAAVRAHLEQRAALDRRAAQAGREWEEIQHARVSLAERRAGADAAVVLVDERLRAVAMQRQRADREASRYCDEREALRAERARLVETERGLLAREDQIRAEVEVAGAHLSSMDVEAAQDEEEAEAHRRALRAIDQERARLLNDIAGAEAREAAHRDRILTLDRRIVYLRERLDGAETQRSALADESAGQVSNLEGARNRLGSLRADLEEHTGARDALLADERHHEIERERLASRLRFLEEAQAQYRGYDAGAQELLLALRANPDRMPEIRGTVADCLSVPKDLRPAIEAALGPNLSALVVSSVEDARAALAALGGEPRGAVTFLPVSMVRTLFQDMPLPDAVAADPATLGRALDQVVITGADAGAVRALLRDVLIVMELGAALRARAAGYGGRIVSLAGEVLSPEGVLTAGGRLPRQGGILGRTEEMADIRTALETVDASIGDLGRRRASVASQIREIEAAVAAAGLHEAREGEAVAEGRRRLTLIEAEIERLVGEIAHLGGERAAADHEATAQQAIRERTRQEAEGLGARVVASEEQIMRITAGLRDRAEARRAAAVRITEARVALTEVSGRRDALLARIGEIDKGIAQTSERYDESAEELRRFQADADRLGAEREVGRARCEAIDAESARLASSQAALEDERAGIAAGQAEAEAQHRQALDRTAALAEETHRAEVREAQIEAELGSARRRIEEEFGITYDRAAGAVPNSVNREETLGRIEALRGLIAATGPVNLLAIEEHRQVSERAKALRLQVEDVQGTIAALRTLIVRLEDVIHEQFERTYDAVNAEFAAIFARLFGGGRAGLERVPGLNGVEPGIDIVAQPPGKKLRSLGALSGGERVMVALALVFAMLRVRPSPFCVFDEVEAALDEPNTRKVGEVLRELSRQTQIIIITHNKATMEASDALFGVTMEETGVSQMVSMRLVEPEAGPPLQPVG